MGKDSSMARKETSFADDLIEALWWVSVILAIISYGLLKYAIPALWGNSHAAPGPNGIPPDLFLNSLAQASPTFATPALLFFLMMAALFLFNSFRKGNNRTFLFNKQRNMETLRSMSWQDFERLVGDAYRRRGYTVIETGGGGAYKGVDLVLEKNGETIFVQCKHWKMESVGVVIVHELLGVVYDKKASGGIVITSGTFTQEAIDFSKGNPIKLVNGKQLFAMIGRIKADLVPLPKNKPAAFQTPVRDNPASLPCPWSGGATILSTAKKGPTPVNKLYGCSTYPERKETGPFDS
jgi:restriction system protein